MNPSDDGSTKTKTPIIRYWNAHFVWLWPLGVLIWIGIAIHAWQLSANQQWTTVHWGTIATDVLLILVASSLLSQPARTLELAPGGVVTFALHYLAGAREYTQVFSSEALNERLRINTIPDSESYAVSYELVLRIRDTDFQFRGFLALDDAEALKAEIRDAHLSMINLTQAN